MEMRRTWTGLMTEVGPSARKTRTMKRWTGYRHAIHSSGLGGKNKRMRMTNHILCRHLLSIYIIHSFDCVEPTTSPRLDKGVRYDYDGCATETQPNQSQEDGLPLQAWFLSRFLPVP